MNRSYTYSIKNTTNVSEFHRKDKVGKKDIQSDILPVDQNLAWHHSSATTALWSGDFDVQHFAEVYVETKNNTSRVIRITYHFLFTKENILNTGTVKDEINAHFQNKLILSNKRPFYARLVPSRLFSLLILNINEECALKMPAGAEVP